MFPRLWRNFITPHKTDKLHHSGVVLVKERILVAATPFPVVGGGGLRALRSINEYVKYFNVHLFLPYSAKKYLLSSGIFRDFVRSGVTIAGFSTLPSLIRYVENALRGRVPLALINLVFTPATRPKLFVQSSYRCVISLHEGVDVVYTGYTLSSLFNTPAICLLQLPPFYGLKERLHNIMKAHILWRKYIVATNLTKLLSVMGTVAEYNVINSSVKNMYNRILRKYDVIMAVSRSIPYEMGHEWIDKIHVLDPGVSLDEDDLRAIERVRTKVKEKDNYIVFGGRPVGTKGIVEALIALKFISKRFNNIKLIFTGSIEDNVLRKIIYVCRKLGIEDKIVFTGFLSRDKRFRVVARAKLMLYPSHMDAFPYAVLESLYLGTPIVAYDIPALKLYYSNSPGVKLVKEWDLEALAAESIDVLEKGVEGVKPPKLRKWREIMDEEVVVIKRIMERS